jgi:flagellar protein FliO/FliZ
VFASTTGVLAAQESVAGNAVAEQLAQSSLRMIGSLVAVLALVAACSWLLKRWRDRQSVASDAIEIVSGISLGSKERVVLLRVGHEQVLVGVSPAGMRSLHVVRDADSTQSQIDGDEAERSKLPPAVATPFSLTLGAAQ